MATQKALFLETPLEGEWKVRERNVPKPGPGEMLVKVHAASLNPVDWFIRKYAPKFPPLPTEYPMVLGFDIAGTVEELGDGVTGLEKGERVLLKAGYGNDYCAYQQYTLGKPDFAAKVPSCISLEQASCFPTTLNTAVNGLYGTRASVGAPFYVAPWMDGGEGKYKGEPLIVFGGATSVGQFVIQLAKLSGFNPIIASASPKNAELLTSLGATHIIDRASANIVSEITEALNGSSVKIVYDAVTQPDTIGAALQLLAPGGVLARHPRPYEVQTVDGKYDHVIVANYNLPENRELGLKLYAKLPEMLEKGLIKPTAIEVLPGGLDGIPAGVERLGSGQVSAKKLVARPNDS